MINMVDDFDAIIAGSLNLQEPWHVDKIAFKQEESALHIHVGVREEARFACPVCGSEIQRYGYANKERVRRHGTVFFMHLFCPLPQAEDSVPELWSQTDQRPL